MNGKHFLDTNIFVYSFDGSARHKRGKSRELIATGLRTHQGIISTQVLQEFLNVATRKFVIPMSLTDAQRYIDAVLAPLCEVYPSISLYHEALDVRSETQYSFYDSLIIAAAIQGDCAVLYSEDFQHDRTVRGLRILNPFS